MTKKIIKLEMTFEYHSGLTGLKKITEKLFDKNYLDDHKHVSFLCEICTPGWTFIGQCHSINLQSLGCNALCLSDYNVIVGDGVDHVRYIACRVKTDDGENPEIIDSEDAWYYSSSIDKRIIQQNYFLDDPIALLEWWEAGLIGKNNKSLQELITREDLVEQIMFVYKEMMSQKRSN